ncbi:hypothetical protein KFE98_18215 [bacterium SCSIO 12741]|nr:hypothetical protein KFE98_18215 [bacterium SCSIO 12741]
MTASVYACPMDCEDGKTYAEPTTCPTCGMDLEQMESTNEPTPEEQVTEPVPEEEPTEEIPAEEVPEGTEEG